MSAAELLHQLSRLGVVATATPDGFLDLEPAESLTAELLETIKAHKAELLEHLATTAGLEDGYELLPAQSPWCELSDNAQGIWDALEAQGSRHKNTSPDRPGRAQMLSLLHSVQTFRPARTCPKWSEKLPSSQTPYGRRCDARVCNLATRAENGELMPLKPSSLAWVRLNSVPVIRAARPTVTRAFVSNLVGLEHKLKSLDDLEPDIITDLNTRLAKLSNDALEHLFLEYLKGSE